MCGRITLTKPDAETVQTAFDLPDAPPNLPARYNIAPTQYVLVIAHDAQHQNKAGIMRWGLVPRWFKGQNFQNPLFNARAETIHEKNSFKDAFKKRRCLIVADGFYEWQKTDTGKIPHYIRLKGAPLFGFAGIWERWHNADTGDDLLSCSVITCEPNNLMSPIHHRMPVILQASDYDQWLRRDPNPDTNGLRALLRPLAEEFMEAYPVSTAVNRAATDDPSLINPVEF